jgi:hypothetical protein
MMRLVEKKIGKTTKRTRIKYDRKNLRRMQINEKNNPK